MGENKEKGFCQLGKIKRKGGTCFLELSWAVGLGGLIFTSGKNLALKKSKHVNILVQLAGLSEVLPDPLAGPS
jgi:hypothetical protein